MTFFLFLPVLRGRVGRGKATVIDFDNEMI
jgi:hypothetical protein